MSPKVEKVLSDMATNAPGTTGSLTGLQLFDALMAGQSEQFKRVIETIFEAMYQAGQLEELHKTNEMLKEIK